MLAATALTVDPLQGIADARSLVHEALWGSMASISSQHETLGMPFANIVSFADGTAACGGTGIPYMLVSPLDDTVQDYKHNAAMSLSLTRAQLPNTSSGGDLACAIDLGGDPESPPCTRLTLTGTFLNISGSPEAADAQAALFERHPLTKSWVEMGSHAFFFAKLNIKQAWLIDHFGGAVRLSVPHYLSYKKK